MVARWDINTTINQVLRFIVFSASSASALHELADGLGARRRMKLWLSQVGIFTLNCGGHHMPIEQIHPIADRAADAIVALINSRLRRRPRRRSPRSSPGVRDAEVQRDLVAVRATSEAAPISRALVRNADASGPIRLSETFNDPERLGHVHHWVQSHCRFRRKRYLRHAARGQMIAPEMKPSTTETKV